MQQLRIRAALLAAPFALVSAALSACAGPGSPPGRTPHAVTTPPAAAPSAAVAPAARDRATHSFARLEHRFGARLGVYVLDTGTGRAVTYRADQRFAYCSTGKALAAGILLQRATPRQLDQRITYSATDLVYFSPVTSRHLATGMTARALIAAAVQYSDNTAANIVLRALGGPAGLQAGLRELGDTMTTADRYEPALSEAVPGDVRDASTPRALGTDLRLLVLGRLVLDPVQRRLLTRLLLGNTTGGPYIRAGVPAGWKVADRTGHGGWGTRNDIAIAWPPSRPPVVIAILSRRRSVNATSADALIADATRTALAALGWARPGQPSVP